MFSETPEADMLPGPTLGEGDSAARLREAARRALNEANRLEALARKAQLAEEAARRPRMPTVSAEDRPVVYFTRYQAGREYAYAAIGWSSGRSVRWSVTGQESRRFTWAGLLEFIGEANWPTLVHMTGGDHLLPPGAEPPVAERIGAYRRMVDTETVGQWHGPAVEPWHGQAR